MDVLLLSRIQFAASAAFHFLFPPLTIGLAMFLAITETKYARTLDPLYKRMGDFWGKIFSIHILFGIVTGIAMEFQFGTNWSNYSKFMGDIFGSPLAIEALVAFFLESTFLCIWLFGKDKFKPKLRAFCMWMIFIGTNISALWIITADGFMQNPVGYVLRNGRAEVTDFFALITNPYALLMLAHTLLSCFLLAAFFIMGVSAYHLLKKKNIEFFMKSFKYALVIGLISSIAVALIGHQTGVNTAKVQPAKAAAMEAVWETTDNLGFSLISIPNTEKEENTEFLTLPKLGSFLYTNSFDGEVTGLKDIPEDERPPVSLVFWSFRIMVGLGVFFILATLIGTYLYRKNKLENSTKYLKMMKWTMLFPFIAINAGWIITEVGRQPWVVYGLMKTADGVSPISVSQVAFSLSAMVIFYGIMLVTDVYLISKFAKKGPEQQIAIEGGEKYVS